MPQVRALDVVGCHADIILWVEEGTIGRSGRSFQKRLKSLLRLPFVDKRWGATGSLARSFQRCYHPRVGGVGRIANSVTPNAAPSGCLACVEDELQYPCKDLNLDNRFRKPAFSPIELQGQRRHYNTICQPFNGQGKRCWATYPLRLNSFPPLSTLRTQRNSTSLGEPGGKNPTLLCSISS